MRGRVKRIKVKYPLMTVAVVLILLSFSFGAVKVGNYIYKQFFAGNDWNATSARVYYYWTKNSSFGGIEKKNIIHVFAFEGDTITVGSNVYNAGYDITGQNIINDKHEDEGSVDVVMYDLNGKATAIDITKNGVGYIGDVATEKAAKEMTSSKGKDGYVPWTYAVSETGIYSFELRSYGGSSNGSLKNNKTIEFTDSSDSTQLISAWDISVFDENDNRKSGRTYTNSLALELNGTMKEKYYIMTDDSYIYEMKFNGISPYTFTFIANNRGLYDNANGNIVYKSVKGIENSKFTYDDFGVSFRDPNANDTDLSKSFKIFFEEPNEDLLGHLYEKAILPDPASNVKFVSNNIKEGNGGYFSFNIKEATTATLRIEFNGKLSEYKPVEISDVVIPFSDNYFYWDGKDGDGKVIPKGEYTESDISYSVTTKAGEVHFPLHDIETAVDGITFTRVNHIYDKEGKQIDTDENIYGKTKNVIYYDDSSIYYGEKVGSTGIAESKVKLALNKFTTKDGLGNTYYSYSNLSYKKDGSLVGEMSYFNNYGKKNQIRLGDHSHITNNIDYSRSYEEQQEKIDYLDSAKNPVGLCSAGENNPWDFGIANYWTFTPTASITKGSSNITITSSDSTNKFNLTSRVFYDENSNGKYNPNGEGDHLLGGVNLEIYKETADTSIQKDKKYVYVENVGGEQVLRNATTINVGTQKYYELVQSGTTSLYGKYIFTELDYDEAKGTEYLFYVLKPYSNYIVTSKSVKPTGSETYGPYNLYHYSKDTTGSEIQIFTVGGDNGIKLEQDNKIVTTIDVGYTFTKMAKTFQIKKNWEITSGSKITQPNTTIFEISYNINGKTSIYEEKPLSAISGWNNKFEFLEQNINGQKITDYYISSEYYIYGDKIFKHVYHYDKENGIYESLVGEDYYFSLSEYYSKNPYSPSKPSNSVYEVTNIPDYNNDGVSNCDDLQAIPTGEWKKALPAGSQKNDENVVSPFNSVIDRNVGSDTIEISITNSTAPGTIEILKYTGALKDANYLQGATFRLYKGDIEYVKAKIKAEDEARMALAEANDDNRSELQELFEKASKEVKKIQVDSQTTRANGRIAFSGLDPSITYTIREKFAPNGYRVAEEYYQVNANTSTESMKFDDENYCLVPVGNAEASTDLEVRKEIVGRAWDSSDNFTFDFNQSEYEIDSAERTLFSTNNKNLDDEILKFKNAFSGTSDLTVNYDDDYAVINGQQSITTKTVKGILNGGNETESSAFNGHEFPAAGVYTFTIMENPIEKSNLITSTRKYIITINVERRLNMDSLDEDLNLSNSHLEATLSNISYQDEINKGEYGDVSSFAGNNLTFINEYQVEDFDVGTEFKIQSNLTGRSDNAWLGSDAFTYVIDGLDDATKEALKNNQIIIEGAFDKSSSSSAGTSKEFTIYSDTSKHQFSLEKIDFHNITFETERTEEGQDPITKPKVYYLTISEKIPELANNSIYKGISYSDTVYTIKITLENESNDNLIDKTTFEIFKDYDIENPESNEAICVCTFTQDASGKKQEQHDNRKNSHVLVFENKYDVLEATWAPTISKTLLGRDWDKNDNFRFEISLNDKETTGVIMPNKNYVIIKPENGDSLLEGTKISNNFSTIRFTNPGTYNFSIKETFNNVNGITIDTSSYDVNVVATDDNEGHLVLKFNGNSLSSPTINYKNSYNESGNFDLYISNTLLGRNWSAKDVFTFYIDPDSTTKQAIDKGELKMPKELVLTDDGRYKVEVKNDESNDATIKKLLGTIEITKGSVEANKYQFVISEECDNLTNIICVGSNTITLDLNVTRERDENSGVITGNLETVATFTNLIDGEEKVEEGKGSITIPFVNQAYIDSSITINNSFTGRDWQEDDKFNIKFVLNSDNPNNFEVLSTEELENMLFDENNVSRDIKLRFYEVGTYTFDIEQIIPEIKKENLTYDDSVFTIIITITDKDGALEKDIKILKKNSDNQEVKQILFNNYYKIDNPQITNPNTGIPTPYLVLVLVLILGLGLYIVVYRKKYI